MNGLDGKALRVARYRVCEAAGERRDGSRGKNSTPWGELLKPDEIDALWAYVAAGGKN